MLRYVFDIHHTFDIIFIGFIENIYVVVCRCTLRYFVEIGAIVREKRERIGLLEDCVFNCTYLIVLLYRYV